MRLAQAFTPLSRSRGGDHIARARCGECCLSRILVAKSLHPPSPQAVKGTRTCWNTCTHTTVVVSWCKERSKVKLAVSNSLIISYGLYSLRDSRAIPIDSSGVDRPQSRNNKRWSHQQGSVRRPPRPPTFAERPCPSAQTTVDVWRLLIGRWVGWSPKAVADEAAGSARLTT